MTTLTRAVPVGRLSRLRRAQGLTLRELAGGLSSDGHDVGWTTVRQWEQGTTPIPDQQKAALCDLFGVSVGHLLGTETQPSRLSVVGGERRIATGEQVLREGARMFAEYLTRRLDDVDQHDPGRDQVLLAAARLREMAG